MRHQKHASESNKARRKALPTLASPLVGELLDKGALGAWCENNPWIDEDHSHESRQLVTDEAWLLVGARRALPTPRSVDRQ